MVVLMAPREDIALAENQQLSPSEKRADTLVNEQLKISGTVAEYHGRLRSVATELRGDAVAETRFGKAERKIGKAAELYGNHRFNPSLRNTSTKGVNHGLSSRSDQNPDEYTAAKMVDDEVDALVTGEHEFTHSKQRQVRGLIGRDRKYNSGLQILEGDADETASNRHLGGARRGDQPDELYGKGETFVEDVGHDTVKRYARKNGDRSGDFVWAQAEVLRGTSRSAEEIEQALQDETDFTGAEVAKIMARFQDDMNSAGSEAHEKAELN
mgnify:CR=1 FL=1